MYMGACSLVQPNRRPACDQTGPAFPESSHEVAHPRQRAHQPRCRPTRPAGQRTISGESISSASPLGMPLWSRQTLKEAKRKRLSQPTSVEHIPQTLSPAGPKPQAATPRKPLLRVSRYSQTSGAPRLIAPRSAQCPSPAAPPPPWQSSPRPSPAFRSTPDIDQSPGRSSHSAHTRSCVSG